jgi:hypothetical protein
MRYTVVWVQAALNELTQIWVDADDRQQVTDAANRIDRELATDPDLKGYQDEMGVRILRFSPIEVAYMVLLDDRIVRVNYVQRAT